MHVGVDESNGHVYVNGLSDHGKYTVDEFGASISEEYLGQLRGTPAGGFMQPEAIALNPANGDLYIADGLKDQSGGVIDVFGPDIVVPGATVQAPSSVHQTTAVLSGGVNPAGLSVTSCEFEYGTGTSYGQSAPCVEPDAAELGAGSSPVAVHADLSGLQLSTTYHYRLNVGNANGSNPSSDESFTTPSAVEGLSTGEAQDVASTGAKLTGSFSPNGTDAHYYFQYGTSTSYGSTSPAAPGANAGTGGAGCVPPGGTGCGVVSAETTLGSLAANTTYHYRLVAVNSYGTTDGEDATFTTAGTPRVDSESAEVVPAEKVGQTNATLHAAIDPSGRETTYHFEYGETVSYGASVPAPAGEISAGFVEEGVTAQLSGLKVGTTYHYRVVASNEYGSVDGPDETFTTLAAALVVEDSATEVAATSATLNAQINPLGTDTSAYFQYGAVSCAASPASCTDVPLSPGIDIGSAESEQALSVHMQSLTPGVLYYYRVLARNGLGTVAGPERTFTTQLAGGASTLPDGRAWELVSPPDKGGALIEDVEVAQAASDGSGIVYAASEPIGEGIVGHVGDNADALAGATVLSTRGADGWRTRDISPKESLPPEGKSAGALFSSAEAFMTFTPDLSHGILEPRYTLGDTPQSPEASEPTLYLRDNTSEKYQPLVTAANVPPGTKLVPPGDSLKENFPQMAFVAATPDLSHVVLSDWAALTPEAATQINQSGEYEENLYEWSDGQFQLVNIVPNETTMREEPKAGAAFGTDFPGSGDGIGAASPWAISDDGRWIVFHYNSGNARWYVRDMVGHKTLPFGRQGETWFETMSRDGSRLFYLEGSHPGREYTEEGELNVVDPATGTVTDLTSGHPASDPNAGVEDMSVDISEDGSCVYFVAKGVLASGAVQGQNNLYVMHEEGGEWKTTLIATLSSTDQKAWAVANNSDQERDVISRVTPNGRYLTFMSDRSLTGYDNTDALSGQPDEEVYLYDVETNRLVCASCNPSGARPIGVEEAGNGAPPPLMDQIGAWSPVGTSGTWLAGSLAPDWHVNWYAATHRTNDLSDDGRLFFNSSDALGPQDTNGLADVYEYEPPGVGSCTSASPTFSERSGGCVSLISSGQSLAESTFLEASESGDDVFFITAAKLVGEDYGDSNDVYDAHVCTTTAPCHTAPVSPPPCTSGDSCKAAPSPQPAIFGPPPSASFSGAGNVTPERKSIVGPKVRPLKCGKGSTKKRGRCVKRSRSKKIKAKRVGNRGRARR